MTFTSTHDCKAKHRRSVRLTACAARRAILLVLLAASWAFIPLGRTAKGAAPTTQAMAGRVDQLLDQLDNPDPAIRDPARLFMLNLPGDAYEPVEAALARPDLPPAARTVLQAAAPRLKVRARWLGENAKEARWAQEALHAEWARIGRKDPRWDALVEQGFARFAGKGVSDRRAAQQAFEKAIAAGCDDALVIYLDAQSLADVSGWHSDEVHKRLGAAARAMLASNYGPGRKMLAIDRYYRTSRQLPADIPVDEFLKWTVEAAKDPDVPSFAIREVFYGLMTELRATMGTEAALKKIYPAYQKAMPGSWYPLLFKAQNEIQWAWDARGSGWANTVTPQGWKLMGERIAAARSTLEQAWRIDPTQSPIAREMVTVCMAESDRQGLEQWFRRGIEANPDDYQLCHNKLYAIMPRWLGSHEEMLAFARQCAATENVFGGIPNILLDAHQMIADESPDAAQYWRQPTVWDETRKVFENRVLVYPTRYNRSRYAEWAARCEHWDVVAALCQKLGEYPDRTVFPDREAYKALRAKAQQMVQEQPASNP